MAGFIFIRERRAGVKAESISKSTAADDILTADQGIAENCFQPVSSPLGRRNSGEGQKY
jgi:hypothetical protein